MINYMYEGLLVMMYTYAFANQYTCSFIKRLNVIFAYFFSTTELIFS